MKVAFVGASGYGNAGDDVYPIVFTRHLPGHEVLIYNSDLPETLLDDIGLLAIGGGGVLHNVGAEPEGGESSHFRCMRHYMDWAIEKGIPWGFVSCGYQFQVHRDEFYRESLRPWVPYLQRAHFITLRSPRCVRITEEISGRSDALFFPDAAYLYDPGEGERVEMENLVTLVPAGLVNPRNVHTLHCLRWHESSGMKIQWLGMGAAVDDEAHLLEAARRFPHAEVIPNPGPAKAWRALARSRFVMTGRYHGMVFCRRLGIPFYVPADSPYKICQEDLTVEMSLAAGHLETLQRYLDPVTIAK